MLELTYGCDGFSVGHETKGILENPTCMEERQGNTHEALQTFLCPSKPGSSLVPHLIKHFVLPKGEDWHQMSTGRCFSKINNIIVAQLIKS